MRRFRGRRTEKRCGHHDVAAAMVIALQRLKLHHSRDTTATETKFTSLEESRTLTHSLTHCICLTFRTHRSMLCVGLTRTILTMTQRPGLESISSLGALTDLEEVGLGDSEPRRSEIRARAGRILFTTCLVLTCFTNCRSKNKKIGIEIRFRRYDDKKPKFVSVQNNFIGC